MSEIAPSGQRVIRISKKKLIVGILLLFVAAGVLVAWLKVKRGYYDDYGPMYQAYPSVGSGGSSYQESPIVYPPSYYDYKTNTENISDTREFLKTNYSAELKTRDVREVAKDVRAAVRDVGGRIDNSRVSEKSAHISFVVPESEFESFREEIESLVHKKLYFETVSSENLLGQKRSIEDRTEAENNYLRGLQAEKQELDKTHATRLASLNRDIAATQVRLTELRQQIAQTENRDQLNALRDEEDTLIAKEATLRRSKDLENTSYASRNSDIESRIRGSESNIEFLRKEDVAFADNIATVTGSVSVTWTGWWEIARLISPIHPGIIIAVLVLLLFYYLRHKRYIPRVEFV